MPNKIELMNSGNLKLDFSRRRVFLNNDLLILRNLEFNLLICLVKNSGRIMSRTQLLEEVWDRNICWSTNTVDVHVSKLRRIFRRYLDYELIKTVHSIGYIFEV